MAHVLVSRAALALSDDLAVECILTVIPLLCMGIMSFGAFTFVLVMKRVDLLTAQLFISCFFGFIAAILDLGQVLIRGQFNVTNGLALSTVAGFIRAREVFLALSVGFLYFFYWLFAGRAPTPEGENEVSARPAPMKRMGMETSKPTHCARWERWGYIGIALKWITLLGCFLIIGLQMVWRLAPRFRVYGDLYVASATMETTISAIFILKLLLNLYLAPLRYQKHVLLSYLTPTAAFMLSASMGVGNLVFFGFSETSLGRFLRGVEVYLLIIFYLVVKFTPSDASPPVDWPLIGPNDRVVSQEKVTFDIRPPSTLTRFAVPTLTALASGKGNPSTEGLWRFSRMSDLSKMSSWVTSARNSRRSVGKDIANRPQSWQSYVPPPNRSLLLDPRPQSNISSTNGPAVSDQYDADEDRSDNQIASEIGVLPPRLSFNRNVRLTDLSLSYYAMESELGGPKAPAAYDSSTLGSESPIYGLNGITLPQRARRISNEPPPPPAQVSRPGDMTPVSRLLQEQSLIDSTIANLRRQINERQGDDKGQPNRADTDPPTSPSLSETKMGSPSPSDFSLSNFPDPPRPDIPTTAAPTTASLQFGPSVDTLSASKPNAITRRLPPTSVPRQLDIPPGAASSLSSAASPSYPSAGTRYDVTSFIDDLTAPRNDYPPLSGSVTVTSMPTGPISPSEGDLTLAQASPSVGGTPVGNVLSRKASRPLGSATMSSFPRKEDQARLGQQNVALRTFLSRNGSVTAQEATPLGRRVSRSNSLTNPALSR